MDGASADIVHTSKRQEMKELIEEFRKINEELGKTLLMVTHDPQMASRCKRVIFLKDGYVMNDVRKEGTEEEFYRTIIGEMEKF